MPRISASIDRDPAYLRLSIGLLARDIGLPDPDLTDGVVRLRRWTLADTDCLRLASADPRIRRGTTVPIAYTPEEGRAYIERQWRRLDDGSGVSFALANAASDEAVGNVYLGAREHPVLWAWATGWFRAYEGSDSLRAAHVWRPNGPSGRWVRPEWRRG